MGDLNGHSNTGDDFIRFDSDIDHIPLPTNYNADIDLFRRNHDTRPIDNRGKEILDICKSGSSMKIINRRKLGDTNGMFTCYSRNALMPSIIDYTIVDKDLFHEIRYFRVDSLTTFSDHCPISFRLKTNFMVDTSTYTNHMELLALPDKFVWNDNSPGAFKCSLNSDEIRKALKLYL